MNDTTIKEDDEEIIDLTDLLEEGEVPQEQSGDRSTTGEGSQDNSTIAQEPETFDLGKEITMEDDVSVEEIESVSDDFDIEVSLSTGEEAALVEETGEETGASVEAETRTEPELREGGKDGEEEMPLVGKGPDSSDVLSEGELEEEHSNAEVDSEAEAMGNPEPVGVKPEPGFSIDDLRKDIPLILEGIVRPVMGELVRELITATREMLPGIVEKVIREEIEKLKKV